jgi:hypothetical protein
MDHEERYAAIKTFLKATKNMVQQLEHDKANFLLERTRLLETALKSAYERRDSEKIRRMGQRADDLAVEILDLLEGLEDFPILEPTFQTLKGKLLQA